MRSRRRKKRRGDSDDEEEGPVDGEMCGACLRVRDTATTFTGGPCRTTCTRTGSAVSGHYHSHLEPGGLPMVILLVIFCAMPAATQQNDNFKLQPPPDIHALGPPPKPPWVKYELECSETEASGIRRVLAHTSTAAAFALPSTAASSAAAKSALAAADSSPESGRRVFPTKPLPPTTNINSKSGPAKVTTLAGEEGDSFTTQALGIAGGSGVFTLPGLTPRSEVIPERAFPDLNPATSTFMSQLLPSSTPGFTWDNETAANDTTALIGANIQGVGQLTGGGIAGIVLVILVLVVVAMAAMLYVWYRRKHRISPATVPKEDENYLYNYGVRGRKWSGKSCEEKGQLYQKEASCQGSASSIDGGYGGEISQSSTHTEELALPRDRRADHHGGSSNSSGVELSLSDLREAPGPGRAHGSQSQKFDEPKFDDVMEDCGNPSSPDNTRSRGRPRNASRASLPILAPIRSSTQPTYCHTLEDETLPDILQSVAVTQGSRDSCVSSGQPAVRVQGPLQPIPPRRTKRRRARKRSSQSTEGLPAADVPLPDMYQPRFSPSVQRCQSSGML